MLSRHTPTGEGEISESMCWVMLKKGNKTLWDDRELCSECCDEIFAFLNIQPVRKAV